MKHKSMKALAIISAIMMIFAACQYDPYASRYTTDEPDNTDLIGTFVFEQQTIDLEIKEFKDSTTGKIVIPKIQIHNDGRYEVEYLPYFKGFDAQFEGLITMKGNWEKSIVGGIGNGNGEYKNHWGIRLGGLPIELQSAGLMNKEPPYKIIFTFGDPDAGDVMILKKE